MKSIAFKVKALAGDVLWVISNGIPKAQIW